MRKTKRAIERYLEDLKNDRPTDIEATSSVVTITEEMVDSRGNLIERKKAKEREQSGGTQDFAEGEKVGEKIGIQSDVVDVYALESVDEES